MSRDALVVGINKYPFLKDSKTGKYKHLTTPADDAEAIAQLLEQYGEFQVQRLPAVNQDGKLRVNPQQNVKLEELKKAITNLFHPQSGQVPETAILFFAGHGLHKIGDGSTEGYLATSDASPRKELWGLSLRWLRQMLHDSPVRQQIIWLDCCHSGEFFNFVETDLGEFEKGRDRCFIVASRDFQVAYAQAQGEHGVLSGALLQGLDPRLQSDKWVTNFTLVDFVKKALKEAPQHPICSNSGGQIILTGTQSVISNVCPYKGLAYFDFNDEDPKYFYGRELLTKQLVEKVRQSNFLAVLGASGSGKSSVVRAGLLHQLKLGEILPGSDRWKIYEPFTPGEHPLESLERVISVKADQLQGLIKAAAADRVVLIVDQFEEVFTLCRDDTELQKFFQCLLVAVKELGNKLCLILVMRADFQDKCAEQDYAGLATQIDQNLVRVIPMSQQELREAIIKPAEQVSLFVERELISQMIADVSVSPGCLPLLQYVLTELWEKRVLNRLTISDYTRLGGVKKALENHANKVYQSLSTDEQLFAKQIFLELTHLGKGTEDTGQQIRQQDLVREKASFDLVERVVQRLAKEKLVVTGEKEFEGKRVAVINIAHEALISNWDLLGQWLKENREALLKKQDIEDAAKDWREKGKPKDIAYLLQGDRLKQAEQFCNNDSNTIPLSQISQEFVRASQFERERIKKLTLWQISGTLIGALFLTVFGWWQWQSSIINDSRNLVTSSSKLLSENKSFEALIISIKSAKKLQRVVLDTSDLRRQVVDQLQLLAYKTQGQTQTPTQLFKLETQNEIIPHVVINPDSKQIIVSGRDSTVQLREWSGKQLLEFPTNQGWINGVYFTPDRQYLVTVGSDTTLRLWQWFGTQVREFQKNLAPFNSVAFTFDQKLMATISRDGTTHLWNNLGQQLKSFNAGSVEKAVFSPDGKYLVTSNQQSADLWDLSGKKLATLVGGSAVFSPNSQYLATLVDNGIQNDFGSRIWNLNGKQIAVLKEDGSPLGVVFSPDSKHLVIFGSNKFARLWDVSGKQLASFRTNTKWFKDFTFSPSSQQLVSTDFNTSIELWDLFGNLLVGIGQGCTVFSPDQKHLIGCNGNRTTILWNFSGKQVAEFIPGSARNAAFSLDGKQLAVVGDDGALRLWDISKHQNPIFQANKESYSGIKISPDGKHLADTTKDGTIKIQDLSGTQVTEFKGHQSGVCKLVFSPDSRQLASGANDGTIRVWDLLGKKLAEFKVEPEYFQCNNTSDPADQYADLIFSPNNQQLAAIGSGGEVRLWDTSSKEILKDSLEFHPIHGFRREFHWRLAFNSDGSRLIAVGASNQAKVWETSSGNKIEEVKTQSDEDFLSSALFSANNKYVVTMETSFNGNTIIYLRDSDFKEIQKFQGSADNMNFSISPDKQQLAIIENNTVRILDFSRLKIKEIHYPNKVLGIYFKPNSRQFLTIENNDNMQLWDLSGKLVAKFQRPKFGGSIKFSSDGKLLAANGGGILKVWDSTSGKQIADFPESTSTEDIIFSSDNKQLIAIENDRIRFWLVKSYDELITHICNRMKTYLNNSPDLSSENRKVCD